MDEVGFIRHNGTGRVHVALPGELRPPWWARMYRIRPLYLEMYPPDNPAMALAVQPVPCRCGLIATQPTFGERFSFVAAFADEALCRSCHRATPADEQPALFEHEQPGVVELDESEWEMEGTRCSGLGGSRSGAPGRPAGARVVDGLVLSGGGPVGKAAGPDGGSADDDRVCGGGGAGVVGAGVVADAMSARQASVPGSPRGGDLQQILPLHPDVTTALADL